MILSYADFETEKTIGDPASLACGKP